MKIHELVNSPEKWSQTDFALREFNGSFISVDPKSEYAEKWDISGAIDRCYDSSEAYKIRLLLWESVGNIAEWNDSITFGEFYSVIKGLDI